MLGRETGLIEPCIDEVRKYSTRQSCIRLHMFSNIYQSIIKMALRLWIHAVMQYIIVSHLVDACHVMRKTNWQEGTSYYQYETGY